MLTVEELFNLENWSDLFKDGSFWSGAIVLLLACAALTAVLYSDRIYGWHLNRQERVKWLHWHPQERLFARRRRRS